MTLRLQFLKETDKARLYRFKDGTKTWIPRSQVKSTVKFPSSDPRGFPIHEIVVSDWWLEHLDEDPLRDPDDLEEHNRNESNDYRDE